MIISIVRLLLVRQTVTSFEMRDNFQRDYGGRKGKTLSQLVGRIIDTSLAFFRAIPCDCAAIQKVYCTLR